MFCGTGNFSRVEDDHGGGGSLGTWGRRPSKQKATTIGGKKEKKKKKKEKNPYSARGLDKFYTLLADLHGRKQKITAPKDGMQAIWFVSSSSHDWVPHVVRLHEPWRNTSKEKTRKGSYRDGGLRSSAEQRSEISRESTTTAASPVARSGEERRAVREKEKKRRSETDRYLFWSVGVVLGLILLCLATVGRSFSICCTVLWWYSLPVDAMGRRRGGSGRKEVGKRRGEPRLQLPNGDNRVSGEWHRIRSPSNSPGPIPSPRSQKVHRRESM